MTLIDRLALIGNALPGNFPRTFVDRINHPAVLRAILRGVAVTIQAGPEGGFRIATNGAGNKDLVSPNDWTGMRQPWNWCSPENIFAGLRVPAIGQILLLRDA